MPTTLAHIGPIKNLLKNAGPKKQADLEKIFAKLNPTFYGDSDEEGIVFRADSAANRILVGLRCTARLEAHSLAGGILFLGYMATLGKKITFEALGERCKVACTLLNWAVGRDLQQAICQRGLLWITCRNIYFGPNSSRSHPQAYDRLFNTLDRAIDANNEREPEIVWYFVSRLLSLHMRSAGYSEEAIESPHDDYRDTTNFLINKLANAGR